MKINIGCGQRNFGKEWIHIDGADYEHIDSKDILMKNYERESVELIYASHLIEYFDRKEIIPILKRWREILKLNGILRLAVPNFEIYAKLYVKEKISLDDSLGPLYGKMVMGNKTIYHKTMYDYSSLKKTLQKVGMRNIRKYNWRKTSHSKFDDHSQAYFPHMDKENGTLMSLNMECIK
tara:strand:- start:3402 stop:3938 length:537 start_codon:yes stop_codon:yes gene_type:complete